MKVIVQDLLNLKKAKEIEKCLARNAQNPDELGMKLPVPYQKCVLYVSVNGCDFGGWISPSK
jgi:hypothetical protein